MEKTQSPSRKSAYWRNVISKFMRTIRCIAIFFTFTILSSFVGIDKYSMELSKLQKYELLALKNEKIVVEYNSKKVLPDHQQRAKLHC